MQTNPAVEQSKKTSTGQKVRGLSPVGEEKAFGGKDLPKIEVLS